MIKSFFSAKALKDFRMLVNKEHKSLSSCLRTIRDNWAMIEALAEADGLGLEDVTPKYIVDNLHNDNYNRAGVLAASLKSRALMKRSSGLGIHGLRQGLWTT